MKANYYLKKLYFLILKIINKLNNFFKKLKKFRKLFKIIILIIIPLFISIFCALDYKYEEIKIVKEDFPFSQYINIDSPDLNNHFLRYIISKIINTSFDLDFYDVCVQNNVYVEKNGEKMTDTELINNKILGNIMVNIYPMKSNLLINQMFSYLKEKNKNFVNYDNKEKVLYYTLFSEPGKTKCLKLLFEEDGFIFKNLSIQVTSKTYIGDANGDYSLKVGDTTITPYLNQSKIFILTNIWSIIIKAIIIFILIDGIFLIIYQIFNIIKNR